VSGRVCAVNNLALYELETFSLTYGPRRSPQLTTKICACYVLAYDPHVHQMICQSMKGFDNYKFV